MIPETFLQLVDHLDFCLDVLALPDINKNKWISWEQKVYHMQQSNNNQEIKYVLSQKRDAYTRNIISFLSLLGLNSKPHIVSDALQRFWPQKLCSLWFLEPNYGLQTARKTISRHKSETYRSSRKKKLQVLYKNGKRKCGERNPRLE